MAIRLLRVVGSQRLPCGCFVGVYETYDGGRVEIIDDRGPACLESSHRSGATVRCSASHQDSRDSRERHADL